MEWHSISSVRLKFVWLQDSSEYEKCQIPNLLMQKHIENANRLHTDAWRETTFLHVWAVDQTIQQQKEHICLKQSSVDKTGID